MTLPAADDWLTDLRAPAVGGAPLPGHRLTARLGAGASGEVWEALGPDGRPAALKFLDCRARDPGQAAEEVRLLRRLQVLEHPGIVRLHAVSAWGRYLVLGMERAECSLADLHRDCLRQTGKNVPPGRLLGLLEQAAAALDFLAGLRLPGLNLVSGPLQHCDVKPSNLLLVGGALKVADFGLCASAGWRGPGGGFRGTPPYAAPELYQGTASRHTDQYALAVTYCEPVAGARPFGRGAGPGHAGTPGRPDAAARPGGGGTQPGAARRPRPALAQLPGVRGGAAGGGPGAQACSRPRRSVSPGGRSGHRPPPRCRYAAGPCCRRAGARGWSWSPAAWRSPELAGPPQPSSASRTSSLYPSPGAGGWRGDSGPGPSGAAGAVWLSSCMGVSC